MWKVLFFPLGGVQPLAYAHVFKSLKVLFSYPMNAC